MYTKEEISKIRQQFWTKFGQYMKPVPGSSGEKVNWLNYKTGIRHIAFRMDADKEKAIVAIEIKNPLEEERMNYYNQFLSLKTLMKNETGFEWNWKETVIDDNNQPISRISQTIENINVLNEKDWPAIIAFLKPRIMALDIFWEMVKDGFE
jgi:hypothetical protein